MKKTDHRSPERPEPGTFRVRLVRGGPQVAAKIDVADGIWQVTVDGEAKTPNVDPWLAQDIERVWFFGQRISESDYSFLLATAAHAKKHTPMMPAARPNKRIDPRLAPPIYQPKGKPHV